jgi:hypothetical protein
MSYPEECKVSAGAYLGGQNAIAQRVDNNPTVGENLETRISMLKAELARLEASRETLGPLLNMKIRDIRDAMSY